MASAVPMSRSRGSLSGLALLLLGAWGGLAPFIGPYFHLGFQPDKAWSYDMGRLYLVIAPGAVVLLCGLVVMITKSRWLGGFSGLLAALGGLWFVLGRATMAFIGTTTTLSYARTVDSPIAQSSRGIILTELVTFTGLGLLIVFFGALAAGRVSIGAYKDFVRFGDAAAGAAGVVGGGLASVGLGSASPSFGSASPSYTPYQPTSVSPFPPAEEPIVGGQAKFPSQYPISGEDTVAQSQNLGSGSGYPDTATQPGASTNTFTPGQVTYSPGQTKYPPTQEQTNPLTAPTQEQRLPPGQ
jgi:hypothetical protein